MTPAAASADSTASAVVGCGEFHGKVLVSVNAARQHFLPDEIPTGLKGLAVPLDLGLPADQRFSSRSSDNHARAAFNSESFPLRPIWRQL